jgi:hypothetical protein
MCVLTVGIGRNNFKTYRIEFFGTLKWLMLLILIFMGTMAEI